MSDISNPFFPEMARGVLDTAQATDYNIFLCNTGGDLRQERSIYNYWQTMGLLGLYYTQSYDSRENIRAFLDYSYPLVLINYGIPACQCQPNFLRQPSWGQASR